MQLQNLFNNYLKMNEWNLVSTNDVVGTQNNTILRQLELCIDRMNIIHGKADIISEKLFSNWQSDTNTVAPASIEWMTDMLYNMITHLHEKIDIINDKL